MSPSYALANNDYEFMFYGCKNTIGTWVKKHSRHTKSPEALLALVAWFTSQVFISEWLRQNLFCFVVQVWSFFPNKVRPANQFLIWHFWVHQSIMLHCGKLKKLIHGVGNRLNGYVSKNVFQTKDLATTTSHSQAFSWDDQNYWFF